MDVRGSVLRSIRVSDRRDTTGPARIATLFQDVLSAKVPSYYSYLLCSDLVVPCIHGRRRKLPNGAVREWKHHWALSNLLALPILAELLVFPLSTYRALVVQTDMVACRRRAILRDCAAHNPVAIKACSLHAVGSGYLFGPTSSYLGPLQSARARIPSADPGLYHDAVSRGRISNRHIRT